MLERVARGAELVARSAGLEHCAAVGVLERIDEHIRRHELIEPGGEVLCLVSGGPDSTCLFHALRELGYRVSALHVNYCLRGEESDEDARFCAEELGAEVVRVDARGAAARRSCATIRYGQRPDRLRATGHTATDQVETILYRLATSGSREGDQAAPRGRRRPPAAAALARGDRGVLPRARARVPASTPRTRTRCAA